MADAKPRKVALDNSVFNWWAGQGLSPQVQADPVKREAYEAIPKLFALQREGCIVLLKPDQAQREMQATLNRSWRDRLNALSQQCKETYNMAQFPATFPFRFVTPEMEQTLERYQNLSSGQKARKDLRTLASVAIAGLNILVTCDFRLWRNQRVKNFALKEDGIRILLPQEAVDFLTSSDVCWKTRSSCQAF